MVTITVADDVPAAFLLPGHRFTLWAGTDIGHGFITQTPSLSGPGPGSTASRPGAA